MEDISSSPSQIGRSSLCRALLISITGVVVASFAITLYHFIMIKICMRRRAAMAMAAAAAEWQARPFAGVDEKILERIPIVSFTAVKSEIDQDECVVCLGELEDGDTVRLLPTCNHAFHVSCIDQWFAAQVTCPLCRYPVVTEETNPEPSVSEDDDDEASTDDSDRESIISSIAIENSNRESSTAIETRLQLLLHHPSPSLDRRPPHLKRSLSLDPSLICSHLRRNLSSFSTRSTLRRSGSFSSSWCSNHFDRRGLLSAKWLRPLSRLRAGKGTPNGAILPY